MTASLQSPTLILGSASPRRRELLAAAGYSPEILVPDIVEEALAGEAPEAYVLRNARLKAAKIANLLRERGLPEAGFVVLAADTVVTLGPRIFEKPRDGADAHQMLRTLAGREHTVLTGVHLVAVAPQSANAKEAAEDAFVVTTRVTFRELSDREIAAYIATGEPFDKAGAYGFQGRGGALVSRLEGSHTNVIGLPLAEVIACLTQRHGMLPWG